MKLRSCIGQFVTGLVAGLCAAVFPRLSMAISRPPSTGKITVEIFTTEYAIVAILFSVLVGVAVMILGWDNAAAPKETFLTALGIPALLAGGLNGAVASDAAHQLAEEKLVVSEQLARQGGIVVEDGGSEPKPTRDQSRWELHLLPTAFAQPTEAPPEGTSAAQLAPQYDEPKYWIVLHTASTREATERKRTELESQYRELASRYGPLGIEEADRFYVVTLGRESVPYSRAVSKATDVKSTSRGAIVPKLVRARQ